MTYSDKSTKRFSKELIYVYFLAMIVQRNRNLTAATSTNQNLYYKAIFNFLVLNHLMSNIEYWFKYVSFERRLRVAGRKLRISNWHCVDYFWTPARESWKVVKLGPCQEAVYEESCSCMRRLGLFLRIISFL